MAKTKLEKAIGEAAGAFAMEIIEAVKGATLEELIALQGGGLATPAPQKRGRKPGPKPGAKRGSPPGRPANVKAKPGPKPKAAKAAVKKKRGATNFPKCAYPGCGKNRFARGKGFCGDHWRQWLGGKIKAAETYKGK